MQISRPKLIGHDVIMRSEVLGSRKICFADPRQGRSKVNMLLNVHRSHKAYYYIRDGEKGVWTWGEGDFIPIATLSLPE